MESLSSQSGILSKCCVPNWRRIRGGPPSVFLLLISYAVWSMLDGYDITPNGVPDASDQMMLLLLWSVPVTALVLGMVWFRMSRNRANGEVS